MTHSGFRTDISDSVIHFTTGDSADAALSNLIKIIADRKLFAGNYGDSVYNCHARRKAEPSWLSVRHFAPRAHCTNTVYSVSLRAL